MKKALIIDDDRNILTTLQIHLENQGLETLKASSGREGLALLQREKPDVLFLDLKLPDMHGLDVLQEISRGAIKPYVVVITAYATIDTAVKAIKMGAFDYLPKPFTPGQITHMLELIRKVYSLESEVETLKDKLKGITREGGILTRNRKMRKLLKTARLVADSGASILISGESGTGKSVLARLIHDWSPRSGGPFITVDCAGLQENLLESDLFGHIRGAFTGALKDKPGKLELADGGTVFLDEVSEIPPAVQAKFLRFIQDHEFEKVGDTRTLRVDVRVIAATNRDLDELVRENLFRRDLFFRLNVVELFMPPLRERPEDIQLLAEHFLKKYKGAGKPAAGIDEEAMERLQEYPWPGNIRELINVIERGTILSRHDRLTPEDLPSFISDYSKNNSEAWGGATLSDIEKSHIKETLLHTKSIEEAARVLGIDPATLWRKRKKYQLD